MYVDDEESVDDVLSSDDDEEEGDEDGEEENGIGLGGVQKYRVDAQELLSITSGLHMQRAMRSSLETRAEIRQLLKSVSGGKC